MYSAEEFDQSKTKVLKYIVYKKRTEKEIRNKFQMEIEEEQLEDIIQYLKEANYIDDKDYLEKVIQNFKLLKNLSNTELKYKLIQKGLAKNLIDDYFYENKEELIEYEIQSACHIIEKKKKDDEKEKIKLFLLKKGYRQENVTEAFQKLEAE